MDALCVGGVTLVYAYIFVHVYVLFSLCACVHCTATFCIKNKVGLITQLVMCRGIYNRYIEIAKWLRTLLSPHNNGIFHGFTIAKGIC